MRIPIYYDNDIIFLNKTTTKTIAIASSETAELLRLNL